MSNERNITRKDFLKRISAAGAMTVGAGALLQACGGGDTQKDSGSGNGSGSASKSKANDPCSDTSGLTEQELKTREQFKYVAETPNPEKRCDNCALYTQPEGDSPCGGCTLVKGPIHPAGYCTAWAPMS